MKIFGALFILSIGFASAAPTCYVRNYSDAHLQQNPEQFIRRAEIIIDAYSVRMSVTHKDADASWTAYAEGECEPLKDGRYNCALGWDAGRILLSFSNERNGVLVTVAGGATLTGEFPETGTSEEMFLPVGRANGVLQLSRASLSHCTKLRGR